MAIPPYVFCHFAAKSAVKSVGGKHYFPSGYSVPSKTENEHITQSPWISQHSLRNCILRLNFTKNLAILNFLKSDEGKFFLDKLAFSEGYELLYAIAIGYPAESPEAKPRKSSKISYVL